MIDFKDRVLEYALEEVYRGRRGVDLSRRIASAWERGLRGTLEDEELAQLAEEPADREADEFRLWPGSGSNGSGATPPIRQAWLLRRHWLSIAAGAIAAGILVTGILAVWRRSSKVSEPFCLASEEVLLIRGPARTELRSMDILPGDVLAVEEESLRLALRGGVELDLAPRSVLFVAPLEDAVQIDLAFGALEASCGAEPLRIATGFASLRAAPGSRLLARVSVAGAAGTLDLLAPADRARLLLRPDFDRERKFHVRVLDGQAVLMQGDRLETAVAGSTERVFSSRAEVELTRDERQRFDELYREVCEKPMTPYPELAASMRELSGLLADHPPLWELLRERASGLYAKPGFAEMLSFLVDFLHQDPSPESLELARTLWLEVPQVFREEHVVTFAERGAFEFQREVRAAVATWEEGSGVPPPVLAAAYLCYRGERIGTAILRRASEASTRDSRRASLLAALALETAGDDSVWPRVTELVREESERRLDLHDAATSGRLLIVYEAFLELRELGGVPAIGNLYAELLERVEMRSADLAGEEQVRALHQRLFR